eukprot:scaffold243383_cov27-Tisochrysis_lutea.AAC.1
MGSAGSLIGTRAVPSASPLTTADPRLATMGGTAAPKHDNSALRGPAEASRLADAGDSRRLNTASLSAAEASRARDALRFFFSADGQYFRDFLLDEIVMATDALSREAVYTLAAQLGALPGAARITPLVALPLGPLRELAPTLAPPLTEQDEKVSRRPQIATLRARSSSRRLMRNDRATTPSRHRLSRPSVNWSPFFLATPLPAIFSRVPAQPSRFSSSRLLRLCCVRTSERCASSGCASSAGWPKCRRRGRWVTSELSWVGGDRKALLYDDPCGARAPHSWCET